MSRVVNEVPVRQRLLDLAVQTIDEHGEPGIRVSDLSKAAGVTIPTLYHYFGSREGLIEQAQAERFVKAFRADAEAFVKSLEGCTSRKKLHEILQNLFRTRRESTRALARAARVNALGAAYARPSLAKRIVEAHDALVTEISIALAPFQRQGMIRQDIDLRAVIAWYNGAVIGKNLIEIAPSTIDSEQWDRTLDEATLHVLFGAS